MPISPVNNSNISATMRANAKDPHDLIWLGGLYTRALYAEQDKAQIKGLTKVVRSSAKNDTLKKIMKSQEKASGILSSVASGDIVAFKNKLTGKIAALKRPKGQGSAGLAGENIDKKALIAV